MLFSSRLKVNSAKIYASPVRAISCKRGIKFSLTVLVHKLYFINMILETSLHIRVYTQYNCRCLVYELSFKGVTRVNADAKQIIQ